MFKNIINNFIYNKRFKGVTIKDIKLHYNMLIASNSISSLLSILLTAGITLIIFKFGNVLSSSIILAIPLIILVLIASILVVVSAILLGISGMFIFQRIFSIKK